MTPDTPADGALAEAIADLKSCADPGDWTANDFYPVITRGRGASIATVLNAVLSGALTPRPAPEGIKPDGALHPERIWVSAPNDDNEVSCWDDPDEGGTEYVRADLIPRPAEPAQAAQADATDDATAFERADWFWRTMDPDDCGDSPEEAINRAMVGRFCVCEIASSYKGPTRYGFIAPVADPESDDEEFVHFATHPEAIDEARSRALIAAAQEGRE